MQNQRNSRENGAPNNPEAVEYFQAQQNPSPLKQLTMSVQEFFQ